MADQDLDPKQIETRVLDLKEAMERMKRAQADRDDVVVDMKQAQHARLELLAQDVQPVFSQVPEGNEQFEFALTNGDTPRLWIDMTSFVRMGRDKRTYEFIKDTRLGRAVLAQTERREEMARAVTDYVAERILERERAVEGDWQAMKAWDFDRKAIAEAAASESVPQPLVTTATPPVKQKSFGWGHIGMLALGLVAGAAGMVAWAWFGELPRF